MTKMLENGQLEFTFEELDLVGAYDEIKKECDRLIESNEILLSEMLKTNCFVGNISNEFDSNSFRIKKLCGIRLALTDLIYWDVE